MSSKTPGTALLFALLAVAGSGCRSSAKKQTPVAAGSVTPAATAPDPDAPCPARFADLAALDAKGERTCICGSAGTGKVWGSGIYTPGSAICAAAVHAGAITRAGGRVTVRAAPGCAAYLGSSNNKISTSPADRRQRSFYFPSVGDGKCGPASQPR